MIKKKLIICPTFIILKRKTKRDRKISINLNTYRNLHHLVESKCKKTFKDLLEDQLNGIEFQTPVKVTYRVYKQSNRKLDKMNVVSICSKYLMDAITEFGCWEDDNDDIIKKEIILPTKLDRSNPRVEVLIQSIIG